MTVLGKDRNGREVRRGDTVRCGCDQCVREGTSLRFVAQSIGELGYLVGEWGVCMDPRNAEVIDPTSRAAAPAPLAETPASYWSAPYPKKGMTETTMKPGGEK